MSNPDCRKYANTILNWCIAIVWLINGLVCKVLHMVPRHELIVGRILGDGYASTLTYAIGTSEILMSVWILSGIKHRLNAVTQVVIIAAMNITEFILAPDMLLFGRLNIVVAAFLIAVILLNEFVIRKPTVLKH